MNDLSTSLAVALGLLVGSGIGGVITWLMNRSGSDGVGVFASFSLFLLISGIGVLVAGQVLS